MTSTCIGRGSGGWTVDTLMQCLSCPASKHYRHKPFGSHAVRQGLASCSEGLKNLRFWHMKSPRSWKDCPGFIELCQSSKLSPTSAHSDTSQNLSVRQLFSRPDGRVCSVRRVRQSTTSDDYWPMASAPAVSAPNTPPHRPASLPKRHGDLRGGTAHLADEGVGLGGQQELPDCLCALPAMS